jgi:hypothetical protein
MPREHLALSTRPRIHHNQLLTFYLSNPGTSPASCVCTFYQRSVPGSLPTATRRSTAVMDSVTTNRRRCWKRRSADIGGLHLATENSGQGQGWIGDSGELQYVPSLLMLSNRYSTSVAPSLLSCSATCIIKRYMPSTSMV